MSEAPVLVAQIRNEFGKGASRRSRRAGNVPAVLYGKGLETTHLDVPAHELFLIARSAKKALVNLEIDGKRQLVRIQEVQKHAVTRVLLHADFQIVEA